MNMKKTFWNLNRAFYAGISAAFVIGAGITSLAFIAFSKPCNDRHEAFDETGDKRSYIHYTASEEEMPGVGEVLLVERYSGDTCFVSNGYAGEYQLNVGQDFAVLMDGQRIVDTLKGGQLSEVIDADNL